MEVLLYMCGNHSYNAVGWFGQNIQESEETWFLHFRQILMKCRTDYKEQYVLMAYQLVANPFLTPLQAKYWRNSCCVVLVYVIQWMWPDVSECVPCLIQLF